jgi:hypothetical protein
MGALLLALAALPAAGASKGKGEPSELKKVNALVAAIDKAIAQGAYPELSVGDENWPHEGVPPRFKLYYDLGSERLVAAVISAGHESWSTEFRYYFYADGKLMKYTRTYDGRDDQPPKRAMIFAENGAVLWKNTDEPHVPAQDVLRLFASLCEVRTRFAAY